MPVSVQKINDMWRIIEPSGKIAKGANGKPRDGGGHKTESKARAQQRAINSKPRGDVSMGKRG